MPVLPLPELKANSPRKDAPPAQPDLQQFWQAVEQSSQSALLVDYDGTLAPFHSQRDRAFPYPGVAEVLETIVRCDRTRVVIITGRDALDVVPLLGIHPHPEVWGLHGLQRLHPDGTTDMPRLGEYTLQALADAERWLDYQALRHTAEFKPGSIAVHWRGLDEHPAMEIRARALLGWQPIAASAHLSLLEFDGGVEIRPPLLDKGDAVRVVLAELAPDTPTAYLGDDQTDEHAFRALDGRGLSVLVRPHWRKTSARLWLRPPAELLGFLTDWRDACLQGEVAAVKQDPQNDAGVDQ